MFSFLPFPLHAVATMNNAQSSQDFEFDPLFPTTVVLPPTAKHWVAQRIPLEVDSTRQWQILLRALALKGFQQWVNATALDLAVYFDMTSVVSPGINCRVGNFRLCLIAMGSLSDDEVRIPCETLEDLETFAHLYILAEVHEEENRVRILSGLRRDRLLALQQTIPLTLNPDTTYTVPVRSFDSSPEELLLYLNCLNPDTLAAPAVADKATDTATEIEPSRTGLSLAAPLSDAREDVINVGRWLRAQMGAVASHLEWMLLPPLGQLDPFRHERNAAEEANAFLNQLSSEVTVPPTARGAYTDYQHYGLPLRLYAFTWTLFELEVPEWCLLMCLGPSGGSQLPPGIRLRIRDRASVLIEQTLEEDAPSTFLYGQVIGHLHDQFTVTVELSNGTTLNWPPFIFQPEA